MPRTRGLSGVLHMDAGEVLGRGGEPLPTMRRADPALPPLAEAAPAPVVDQPPPPSGQEFRTVFKLTPDLWPRSWGGWHFLHVINAFFVKRYGVELSVTFTQEEYKALHPDIQQHCQRRLAA